MHYLLDTSICVFLLRNKHDIGSKIKEVGIENCFISEITLAELIYGAYCSSDVKNKLYQLNRLSEIIDVIPISGILETYAEIKSKLRKQGKPIDDFDLLICSTALRKDMILVTDNTKHFINIPVTLENWVKR